MMEVYALFRDVISHGLMADLSEKSSRVYKMAYKLDEVQEKLSYIEEAMGFTPGNLGADGFYGKNAHGPIQPQKSSH